MNTAMIPCATSAWRYLVHQVNSSGLRCSPRGMECVELIAHRTVLRMEQPLLTIPARQLSFNFALTEAWWILCGRNDVKPLIQYAPQITKFSDNGETLSGAYGPHIMTQIEYVVNALLNDNDSRQAVLTTWQVRPAKSKDIPCTVSVQFLIRNGYLHCIDTMRSSDVWLGWPYDVFSFSMVSCYVAAALRANAVDVRLGNLHLVAGSQHIYTRNQCRVQECVSSYAPRLYELPTDVTTARDPDQVVKWLLETKDLNNPLESFTHVQ